jgi:hypothetical protein
MLARFKFEAFTPDDLDNIRPRDIDVQGIQEAPDKSWFAGGPAITAWNGCEPVGAGGVVILKLGVGQAWLLASDRLFESAAVPVKIRSFMYKIAKDYALYRIHAFADCRYPKHARYLEFLGMKLEGIHRKLGPGRSDLATFAWVR